MSTDTQVKHTEGPWQVKDIGGFGCKIIGPTRRHPQSSELGVEMVTNSVVAHIATPTQEQADANARLIAAAPELLEAGADVMPILEAIIRAKGIDWIGGFTAQKKLDALKAAIAKAKGR